MIYTQNTRNRRNTRKPSRGETQFVWGRCCYVYGVHCSVRRTVHYTLQYTVRYSTPYVLHYAAYSVLMQYMHTILLQYWGVCVSMRHFTRRTLYVVHCTAYNVRSTRIDVVFKRMRGRVCLCRSDDAIACEYMCVSLSI